MALRKRGGIWYFRKTINGQLFRESTGFADKKSADFAVDVSVRPAAPRYTQLQMGSFGDKTEVKVQRDLFPEFRHLEAGVSTLPWASSSVPRRAGPSVE